MFYFSFISHVRATVFFNVLKTLKQFVLEFYFSFILCCASRLSVSQLMGTTITVFVYKIKISRLPLLLAYITWRFDSCRTNIPVKLKAEARLIKYVYKVKKNIPSFLSVHHSLTLSHHHLSYIITKTKSSANAKRTARVLQEY